MKKKKQINKHLLRLMRNNTTRGAKNQKYKKSVLSPLWEAKESNQIDDVVSISLESPSEQSSPGPCRRGWPLWALSPCLLEFHLNRFSPLVDTPISSRSFDKSQLIPFE